MRMMAIVPRGFEEDTPQVRVPRLGNRAAATPGAARVLRRHEADEAHHTGARRKAARVAELCGDGEARSGHSIPLKHRNRRTGSANGSPVKYGAEFVFDGVRAARRPPRLPARTRRQVCSSAGSGHWSPAAMCCADDSTRPWSACIGGHDAGETSRADGGPVADPHERPLDSAADRGWPLPARSAHESS